MVDPHHPCQCQPNAETLPWLLLHPFPYEGWAHKTPMPRHHWASFRLACFTLSVSSTPPRTSSTKVSSAKQSSCGDGPAENTATSQSSSLPRRSSRTTFRKHSTNSQDTELMSLHFSLARACHARHQNRFHERICEVWMIRQPGCGYSHKSTFARQQMPATHGSYNSQNTWMGNELQNTRFIP